MEDKERRLREWWDGFWLDNDFDPNETFTSLASRYRDGRPCIAGKCFFGSFHVCVRVVFDDEVDWIIRVPLPYRLLNRDMHTKREVAILHYLQENTAIPVPAMIGYGFNETRSSELGPYIITKFIHGIPLTDWFKDPYSQETRLKPHIEDWIIRKIYKQAATILLELVSLDFSTIGTLSAADDEHRTWSIESSPWTITSHEAERNHGIHPHTANGPFTNAHDWMSYLCGHHEQIIREDSENPKQNEDLESLDRFREMVPRFISPDSSWGPFKLHCDDFGAGNMLVDGDYNIVCLGDWEFTYAAPAEYQCCLASWLILSKPYDWTLEDYNLYSTRLKHFLEILEEEEKQRAKVVPSANPTRRDSSLSNVIRKGWEDGTFWFVLCARSGLFFDALWERFRRFHPVNSSLQAGETKKDVPGTENSDMLSSMASLGSTYRNQGQRKEAEDVGAQVNET
ncbi:MAG: hypothetical protein M1837_000488 [Sclerophora amabilis]|nr:MAG: hypothetical protein M1837_000488 [Sclerophora amabilis]